MLGTIVGSKYAGSFIKSSNDDVLTVLGALDEMNDDATQIKLRGVDHIFPFIEKIEGVNGKRETFRTQKLYGVRDGEYQDAPAFNEVIESWFYTREGVAVKDYEFSLSLIQDAYERDIPLQKIVAERIEGISDWYLNNYIPATWYQALLRVPTDAESANFRSAPIGLLKNTRVDSSLLKPGKDRTLRNNYKAFSSAGDATIEELEQMIEEFTEFADTGDGNLVCYGTRKTLSLLRDMLMAPENQDKFNRTGKKSIVIAGIQFIQNDMIPSGKLLLLDGSMRGGLKHFVSSKKDLQGIAVVKDNGNGFDKLDTIKDFVGSYWKVLPEGKFVSGRHKFMWIDTLHNAADSDLNMAEAGLNDLRYYYKLYEGMWNFNA